MKTLYLGLFLLLGITGVTAQTNFTFHAFGNISLVSVGDNYGKSVTKSIEGERNIYLKNSGIGYGADAQILIKRFMAGAGLNIYNIPGNNFNRVELDSYSAFGKAGYNMSSNPLLQIIPALRVGISRSTMKIPFNKDEPTLFGNTVVLEDDNFASNFIFYGGEVSITKLFGDPFGLGVGLTLFADFGLGEPDWYYNGKIVEKLDLNTFSVYGLTLKVGGGYLNASDSY